MGILFSFSFVVAIWIVSQMNVAIAFRNMHWSSAMHSSWSTVTAIPDFHRTTRQFASNLQTVAPGIHSSELPLIKKSRFIGYVQSVNSWSEAVEVLDTVHSEHPKARHVCYGYHLGPSKEERSSDDGEPSGTAGQPILNAIHAENVSSVMCVVVRYFGGVKLGTGGLIRAYGGCARQVLRDAPIQVLIPQTTFQVSVPSSQYVGAIYDMAAKAGATATEEEYAPDGSRKWILTCSTEVEQQLKETLRQATRGSVQFFSIVQ